jgi:hypothetical protein
MMLATMRRSGVTWFLCALVGCGGGATPAGSAGGSGDGSTSRPAAGSAAGSGSAIGSGSAAGSAATTTPAAPAVAPSRLTCADLPGAVRFGLQLSDDGKTVYYRELELPEARGGESPLTYAVHAFDLARRTATQVVAGASWPTVIAGDGTVAFVRPSEKFHSIRRNRVLMLAAPGKQPVAATSDDEMVYDIALDRATSTLWMLKSKDVINELWKLPITGGKLERVPSEQAYGIYGVAGGWVVVSHGNEVIRRPAKGGAGTKIADLEVDRVLGMHGDQVVVMNRSSHKLSSLSLASGKRTELAITGDEIDLTQPGDTAYLIARKGDSYEVRGLADLAAPPVLVTRGVRPTDVVHAGDRLVVLAKVDSNDDGKLGALDETDVCFAAPGPDPIEVHARTLPRRLVDVAARLAPLTASGPLAGAVQRFSPTGDLELTLASAPAGSDLTGLVRQTQTRVTELSGMPHLSVAIRVRDTGERAVSEWDDAAGAFLVSTGIGALQVADRPAYTLELDPKVTYTYTDSFSHDWGDATCTGTVKNISDHPLSNIEVRCMQRWDEDERHKKAKVQPATLAPGARGSYRIAIGYTSSSPGPRVAVLVDGKRAPALNVYAEKREGEALIVAAKVQATTQLAYDHAALTDGGVRPGPVAIYVRAPEALEDGPPEALAKAAAAALPRLREVVPRERRGNAQLRILRGDGARVGWSFVNGKLTEGEPRDE